MLNILIILRIGLLSAYDMSFMKVHVNVSRLLEIHDPDEVIMALRAR